MRVARTIIVLALLAACGAPAAPAAPAAPTAQTVLDALTAGGAEVMNVTTPTSDPVPALPDTYTERRLFTIPALGNEGGQLFVCETRQSCDAVYAYFDAVRGLAGPYYYRSGGGRVVLQLNRELDPATAERFAAAIEPLP